MLFSCFTAKSQLAKSYTAVYTGIVSFVGTALMSVVIVMTTLRYDVIIVIIYFINILLNS
jgi:hypothetical protein